MLALCVAAPAHAEGYMDRPEVRQFAADVAARNGLDRAWVNSVLADAKAKDAIVTAMSKPAEHVMGWNEYRALFLTDKRIQMGQDFMRDNAATLARAESVYGVPATTIAAIIGVETLYGRNAGNYRVLDALMTLGFDYPPRSEFFRKELEQFLLMAHEQGLSPTELKGSYAGAMGLGQFMPSSYRQFSVDFNGDGVADLWNVDDAIGSVARYFTLHGWQPGQAVVYPLDPTATASQDVLASSPKPTLTVAEIQSAGYKPRTRLAPDLSGAVIKLANADDTAEYWLGLQNFYVITRYNHSPMYAMAVYQLGQALQHGR